MSEIYHHGVKGMKWGVRRYQNKDGSPIPTGKKPHLGIDEKGRINLISDKTTSKAKKAFAVRTGISVMGVSLSVLLVKHPEIIQKGAKFVSSISDKSVNDVINNSGPQIFSNKLGRYLTEAELAAKGFI